MFSLRSPISSSPSQIHTPHSPAGSFKYELKEQLPEIERPPVSHPPQEIEYPHGPRLFFILSSLILSVFLVSLDRTIVATTIPRITSTFHSLSQVGWYGSSFFLTLASFQGTWGKAYKYFPMKPSFLLAIGIFELGSLISGVARNSVTLIVGRAIAGCGGAGIAAGAYTLVALSAPPKKRPAYTGLVGATYGVAAVVGPLLGGVFAEEVSWRWAFYVNLPIGGLVAVIILFTLQVPESVQAKDLEVGLKEKILQMDFLGMVTITGAALCCLLALDCGGVTKEWNDKTVVGTLVGCIVLLALFGILEWHLGERALLQGRLIKMRIVFVACVFVMFLGGAFFTLVYYLPIYFQSVSGVSPLESGTRNLGIIVSVSVCTILSGAMITVFGHFVPWMIVGSILATVGAGLLFTLKIGSPPSHWIGYQILAGIGLGAGFQVPIIVAQASVDTSDISSVSAIILFFQTIGGSIFVSAAQSAFANRLLSSLKTNAPDVNPAKVLSTGVTEIRTVFVQEDIHGILLSYLDGLHVAFALAVTLGGISLLAALFAPWRRVNFGRAFGLTSENTVDNE